MCRRSFSALSFLVLVLALVACGAGPIPTATTARAAAPSASATRTATQPPRAAASAPPTAQPSRQQPVVTLAIPGSPVAATPVAPLPAGVVAVPDMGAKHVSEGQPLVLPHSPPSSGNHYPSALPGGIYRQEANPGNWIHSLEHGYVVALVKCSTDCSAIFNQLQTLYNVGLPKGQFGNVKFIATTYSQPYTNGEAKIALAAWDYELLLPTYDEARIVSFYQRFADQGPEAVP